MTCHASRYEVSPVWADTTVEASKFHPAFVAQLARASDTPTLSAVRCVINDMAHSTRCRRRQRGQLSR